MASSDQLRRLPGIDRVLATAHVAELKRCWLGRVVDEEVRAVVQKQIDRIALQRRHRELERQMDERYGLPGIVGRSERMRQILKQAGLDAR